MSETQHAVLSANSSLPVADAEAPSPIRGNFIPVSSSIGGRPRSLSRQTELSLHLHLSLTDSQMDKLTSTLSPKKPSARRVDRELAGMLPNMDPSKGNHRGNGSPSKLHTQVDTQGYDSRYTRTDGLSRDHDYSPNKVGDFIRRSRSRSPAKRETPSRKDHNTVPPSPTGPLPLHLPVNDPYLNDPYPPHGGNTSAGDEQHTPASRGRLRQPMRELHSPGPAEEWPVIPSPRRTVPHVGFSDGSDSLYSHEQGSIERSGTASPLRMSKEAAHGRGSSALESYSAWARSPASPTRPADARPAMSTPKKAHGLHRTATTGNLHQDGGRLERRYSPLPDYLATRNFPVRKELIGTHGWLERTTAPASTNAQSGNITTPQKKAGGLLDGLKKMAKDVTDLAYSRRTRASGRDHRSARLTITLDPREQSLLYCELEFTMTTALDRYITSQFNAGRLDADKYKRVADGWQQKGRPKVVGFRYDLETQLDLILLHSQDFKFYGQRVGVTAAVVGLLEMVKVDARAMRIRTFCQPDTVIAKQLLDAQSLFDMLGCTEQQQIYLAEIIQFFKAVLEREHHFQQQQEAPGSGQGESGGAAPSGMPESPSHGDLGNYDEY